MFLLTLEKFDIQLKGNTGTETAKIVIPGEAAKTFAMTQQWQTYSFPVSKKKTFQIEVEATSPTERVYFRPAHDYEIHYIQKWKEWFCGQQNENIRCGIVRMGHFSWTGLYNFTYVEPGMYS